MTTIDDLRQATTELALGTGGDARTMEGTRNG